MCDACVFSILCVVASSVVASSIVASSVVVACGLITVLYL